MRDWWFTCLTLATIGVVHAIRGPSFPRLPFSAAGVLPSGSVTSGKDANPFKSKLEQFWKTRSNSGQRRLEFWKRSARIYSSYKIFQVKEFFQQRMPFAKDQFNATAANERWKALHEINSQRMLNLSLTLRGFYLKSGQFLGTRHDFMPPEYTVKLSKLHDQVPPMPASEVKTIIESELHGNISDYFTQINLEEPIGSASIAQVHWGVWKATKEKVAVKVQNPSAKLLMTDDLRNLGILANFLQKTELKFDIVSAVRELRRQIAFEFDFKREAKNMDLIRSLLSKHVPNLLIPRSIYSTEKLLVMEFIDGDNLSKLARKQQNPSTDSSTASKAKQPKTSPSFLLQQYGRQLLQTLAEAWGYQIFVYNLFHCDPHPGNICIQPWSKKIGLLDWGQIKSLPKDLRLKFASLIQALSHHNASLTVQRFRELGIKVGNPNDDASIEGLAITLFDTTYDPKYVFSLFSEDAMIKKNPIVSIPPDLYFIVRTVQLLRGMTYSLGIKDFSLAKKWEPYAKELLEKEEKPHRS